MREEADLSTKWDSGRNEDPGRNAEDEEARLVEDRRQRDQDDHLEGLAQQKERYQEQPELRQEEYHQQHLTGVSHRAELEALAQRYIEAGMRPLMLTVKAGGVDVSKERACGRRGLRLPGAGTAGGRRLVHRECSCRERHGGHGQSQRGGCDGARWGARVPGWQTRTSSRR
jgi:hypothetical protein